MFVFVEEVRGFVLFEEFDDIVDLYPAIDHFRPNDDTRIPLFLKIDGLDHIACQHVAELGFDHSRFGRFIATGIDGLDHERDRALREFFRCERTLGQHTAMQGAGVTPAAVVAIVETDQVTVYVQILHRAP